MTSFPGQPIGIVKASLQRIFANDLCISGIHVYDRLRAGGQGAFQSHRGNSMNYVLRAVGALTVVLCMFAASASAGSGVAGVADAAVFAKGTGDDFRSPEAK